MSVGINNSGRIVSLPVGGGIGSDSLIKLKVVTADSSP